MQQRGSCARLVRVSPLNMEFGIDLIHILLDASLGEVALCAISRLLRRCTISSTISNSARRQCAEGLRTETLCASRLRRFADRGDPSR